MMRGQHRATQDNGGGIRGVLTLGYLERVEDILRKRHGGDPDFRLSDYFDLIGGTSTGSIIAAGLALGFSVEKLQGIYRTLAGRGFQKAVAEFRSLFGQISPRTSQQSPD
jgi:patatin-like phospholipase/acyl hydrolase